MLYTGVAHARPNALSHADGAVCRREASALRGANLRYAASNLNSCDAQDLGFKVLSGDLSFVNDRCRAVGDKTGASYGSAKRQLFR